MSNTANEGVPKKWGILAFPKFVGLDVYGPLEILNLVGTQVAGVTVSIIGETKEPVPSCADSIAGVATSYLQPTYTMDEDPELDVLLVPGGPGSQYAQENPQIVDYVKRTYPKLQYIVGICTGAQILAKAGILDGKRATTTKFGWKQVVGSGPNVNWVTQARWVVDGNIWTSSGITSGMDTIYHLVSAAYGKTISDMAVNIMEYEVHRDANRDPFAEVWKVTGGETDNVVKEG